MLPLHVYFYSIHHMHASAMLGSSRRLQVCYLYECMLHACSHICICATYVASVLVHV
jgi:hypothetical protein